MVDPTLDLLKYRPFPELAAALRARLDMILQRWQADVKAVLPSADELTWNEVLNNLPKTLEQISLALESNTPLATKHLLDESAEHGLCRFNQNYNLRELLIEYSLLRAILLEEVGIQLGRSLKLEEVLAINFGLDVTVRRGITFFINHQNQELAATAEAQSKYLAFLSHDLRGGLNGILLMIEVLKRELVSEPKFAGSIEDLDMMRRSILDTVATMDRLLHAERFRKGKVQVNLVPVDLKNLVAEVVGQVSYQAQDKGLHLKVDLGDPCDLICDRDLLSLILHNLVSNAIKYTKKGIVQIVSSKVDKNTAGDKCHHLSVLDEGPGISAENLSQLFTPFTRGETHGQSGVGLGLSIARQAADLLGAKLWAESEVGRGSKFHLELPL